MKQYIAIDIGGTGIKYGTVSQNGDILSSFERKTPADAHSEDVLTMLSAMLEELLEESISGIGIATLGAVDEKNGKVVGMCDNFPGLKDVPIVAYLKEKYHLPVSLMNDVNATALGEAGFGAGKGLDTFFCVTLGTGIGGAYVHNGSVIGGAHGFAGEIGYLWSGRGESYETLASAKRFSEECKHLGNGEEKMLLPALQGNPVYAELLEKWTMDVAHGIADMVYLLDPGTVIIGGAVSGIGEVLTDKISEQLNRVIQPDYKDMTTVVPAKNGNASNMLGAIWPLIR